MRRWIVQTQDGVEQSFGCWADDCQVDTTGALRFYNVASNGQVRTIQIVAPDLWRGCVVYAVSN